MKDIRNEFMEKNDRFKRWHKGVVRALSDLDKASKMFQILG